MSTRVEAPLAVVYAFYVQLDHLRYVSSARRLEWCPEQGRTVSEGVEHTVRIQQAGHHIDLQFRARRVDPRVGYELEFTSWPLRGAVHLHRLEALEGDEATRVTDVEEWRPPWYLRPIVDRKLESQHALFQEKLENAKRLIERVYEARGAASFTTGIHGDARAVGIDPIVTD
ncbi:MAG: hypothetical protein IPK13_26760 [Deltaproteobacteria bacterium]|nr:hypothetical protein [Deltaproteobacteria bacterium]